MPLTRLTLLASTVLLTPVLAQAQTAAQPPQSSTSPLATLLAALLPFALFGLLLYWFLRRSQSTPQSKRLIDYMTRHEQNMVRHEQHMARLEDSHDRIAKALEKRNTP